jgi:hypothetical protein
MLASWHGIFVPPLLCGTTRVTYVVGILSIMNTTQVKTQHVSGLWSPNLMPLDFFLWGYVKCVDCKSIGQLNNVVEPKHQITTAAVAVIPKMLCCVWDESEYQQDNYCITMADHIKIY